jgi:hypothetical protein
VGPRPRLEVVEYRKISRPCRETNPGQVRRVSDCDTPAPLIQGKITRCA